ncbi:MAG: hypothetical protein LBJ00_17635 [Planctomycetaceae bacterium]|nr:hypothetical protein [Planctomycetaceae bacterium]
MYKVIKTREKFHVSEVYEKTITELNIGLYGFTKPTQKHRHLRTSIQ